MIKEERHSSTESGLWSEFPIGEFPIGEFPIDEFPIGTRCTLVFM